MAKKIQLEFDINSKDVKIAGQDTLSLVQQLRILKKELQNPNLGQAEFEILRKKVGDVEDSIARTSTKSKDFFSVLSTLPGPIGGIASSLSGAIDTLKVFSSFSLKDIQNSFTDVIDDIGDVVKNFLGLSDATKKQAQADKELAVASGGATVATEGQAVATNVLTFSERAATFATKALKLALASLGIGLVIFAITELVGIVSEWISGTKAAEKANEEFDKSFKSLTNSIEENAKATKEKGDLSILQAKIEGKSEKELFKIKQDNLNNEIIDNANAKKKLQKLNEELLLDRKLKEDKRKEKIQQVSEEIAATDKKLNDLLVSQRKLPYEEELRVAEEARQKAKEIQTKREQDLKAANDKLRALQQENGLLIIEDERKRAIAQLEITKKNEEDSINLLRISREKRNQLLSEIDKNFRIKLQQVNTKFDKEDVIAKEEFNKKIQDLGIRFIQDETQKQIEARKIQFDREIKDLESNEQFKKKTKIQQLAIRLGLQQEFENDLTKITQEGESKRLDILNNKGQELLSLLSGINESIVTDLNKTQSGILNLTDTLGGYLGDASKSLKEYTDNFGTEILRNQFNVKSFRDLIETIYQSNLKSLTDNQEILNKSFEQGLISADEYNVRLKENQDALLQNRQTYIGKLIELDNLLLDARRQNADATIQVAENIAGLLTAVAGKNIKLQKAAAIVDGLVSIARIIVDTQRANVAFTASVAPLGPAGVPLAAAYTVKNQISAALAIATITAQGINRIKQIDESALSEGGGQQSNGLRRGYAEGGLIEGKRHSQGGTIIEAERGEAIMTRGAVTMFAPMLSMMNQLGGGVSFSSNLSTARPDTPIVSNPSQEQQPLIVKTYVVENEMTSIQQRQARLKDLSTL